MCVLTILGPVRRPWRSRGKGESRAAVQPASFSFPSAAWWTGAFGTRVVYLDFSKRLLLKRRQNAGRPQGSPALPSGGVCVSGGHPQRGRVNSEASARRGHTQAGMRVGEPLPGPQSTRPRSQRGFPQGGA